MKKIKYLNIVIIFILSTSFISNKNNNEDKIIHIIYKMNKYSDNNVSEKKINSDLKQIATDFEVAIEKTEMELFFTKTKSIFKKTEGLNQEGFANKFIDAYIGAQVYYKDIDSKEKIKQIEFAGEKFNVKINFDEYNWEITKETKIINGIKCFKAITHIKSFSKSRNKTIETDINVWFAPSIPYSFGPRGLDGLPGLVLEGSANGKIYFYASKIDFDYKDKIVNFDKPKAGKYVTTEELENIQIKVLNQN